MTSFKIKVCGITRIQDAMAAHDFGAEYIGMIFYCGSSRCVSDKFAHQVSQSLPGSCQKVGVFVNEEADAVLEKVQSVGLDAVQLHGEEGEQVVATIKKAGVTVVKGYSIAAATDWVPVLSSTADYVLVDNRQGDTRGGTGKTFNWQHLPPRPISNLVLAGGINATNVAEGVAKFSPAIIDVNSGVEESPGVKSIEKLKQFFEECDRIRHGG